MHKLDRAMERSLGKQFRLIACVLFVGIRFAHAQSPADAEPETPRPTTTANDAVRVENLQLLVKPLTQEELAIEADAWRDLLKNHVQQITDLRISLKEERATQQATTDAVANASSETPTEANDAAANDAEGEDVAARREQLANSLPQLNEQKSQLVERLNVVLNEYEKKGGDVESYRRYVNALTGLGVEVTDTATAWTILQGWLISEQGGQRWAWNIGKFLLILLAFYFGASIIASLIRHAASRVKGASQLLVDFLGKFVKQLLTVIGLIVALGALEVNITPLLAALGAAGFVIGFALQGTLSNFASGLLILAYQPFDVGDVIEAAGVSGVVDSVSLFSTHVRTFDNKVMIIPNNDIWGGTITNATASDTRRVDMVFGIGYEDDVQQAQTILESLLQDHAAVLPDPAPVVQLNELADSCINFVVRPWAKTEDYWTVYWDITRAVKDEFDRQGISIPFPQRDVHVYHRTASGSGETLVNASQ